MFEISHYSSLDERLEAGPPVNALCRRCTDLRFLELFSGTRYEDYGQGYEKPLLDVVIGTVADISRSAEECRLCYLVSAFHDAKHIHPGVHESKCEGDLECAVFKPYRADVALHMTDESTDSDKESIATSIALAFVKPGIIGNGKHDRETLSGGVAGDSSHNDIVTRTKKVFAREFQQKSLGAASKCTDHGTEDDMFDNAQLYHDPGKQVSWAEGNDPGSYTSAAGMHEVDSQPVDLPSGAYTYHKCLFCLTSVSAVGRRRTLSFSPTAQGSRIDWPSLRGWIKACERDHLRCRAHHTDPMAEGELRLRCIDVKSSTIVPISSEARYLTLSYVWGTAQSELAGYVKGCIIGDNSTVMTESLPSAIGDAIRVTEQLGEQYLWVDSLCLDQSNPSAVAAEISLMDRIYERAVLTLVASTSQNVYSEIPGLRPHSRLRSVGDIFLDGRAIKAVCATTVDSEFRGVWQYRGWTFQEWVLSKRCLFFSRGQVLFRCQESSGLESFQHPTSTRSSNTAIIPKFWADSQCAATILPTISLDSPIWNFHTYNNLVRNYTGRNLTYSSDIFYAFTGIMRKLERLTGMRFVEAMPTEDLLRALLWSSNTPGMQRRRRSNLPSWTWAAWNTRSLYRCWEIDKTSVEEEQHPSKYIKKIGLAMSKLRYVGTLPYQSTNKSNVPVVLSISGNYDTAQTRYPSNAFRLRCAEVALLPAEAAEHARKSCLQVISETRAVLIHRNTPQRKDECSINLSTDDLLHPITKEIMAGRTYIDNVWEAQRLLEFTLSIGTSTKESLTSHDAILLYEWDIDIAQGESIRKVVALIVDRLADGTAERAALVSIHSADWYKLPLVNQREELRLV